MSALPLCPDFDFDFGYIDDLPGYEGLRIAYVDTGPKEAARTFLCLHGEPSWSFLYRRMIPGFPRKRGAGHRTRLTWLRRSDKPVKQSDYSFDFHRNYLLALVERLDLKNITLVVQDWGGLLGLTLPVDDPFKGRLERLIVMNTGLGLGRGMTDGFKAWKNYALSTPDLPIGALIKRGTPHLTDAEVAAYDAPYPGPEYKAGAQIFPALVPVEPDMEGVDVSVAAAEYWSGEWRGKSFMAIGMADPVLGPAVMLSLHRLIKACPPPMEIEGGGHFVQEWGEPIARAALASFGDL